MSDTEFVKRLVRGLRSLNHELEGVPPPEPDQPEAEVSLPAGRVQVLVQRLRLAASVIEARGQAQLPLLLREDAAALEEALAEQVAV